MRIEWISNKRWSTLWKGRSAGIAILLAVLTGMAALGAVFGLPALHPFHAAILVSIFLAVKRKGVTAGVLAFLVLLLVAFYEPQFFAFSSHQGTAVFRLAVLFAWGGSVLLGIALATSQSQPQTLPQPAQERRTPAAQHRAYDLLLTTVTHITLLEKRMRRVLRQSPGNLPEQIAPFSR